MIQVQSFIYKCIIGIHRAKYVVFYRRSFMYTFRLLFMMKLKNIFEMRKIELRIEKMIISWTN